MSEKNKKIFLALTVLVPFLLYCIYYYSHMFKIAPYKFTEFKSIVIKYGTRDSMLNQYNSATGQYQYLNRHDSVVKKTLFLPKSDLLYLHHKAAELGLWDFPSNEKGDSTKEQGHKPTRFFIEFNYQRKSKVVTFDDSYDGDPRLVAANRNLIAEIRSVIAKAEENQKK